MTNQQASVLLALTRTHIPRTLDTMAAELPFPKPSIRRTVSELNATGYTIIRNERTGEYALLGKPCYNGSDHPASTPAGAAA